MGRHRHVVNVRADGIAAVLGPLLDDSRIAAAALVDVDSGMVLDAWSAADPAGEAPDLELIGAQHAEVVRCALALLRAWPGSGGAGADTCEVVLGADDGCRHLLRTLPDPHGDRLALAVVVDGPPRALDRVRKRLRSISVDALTAGPSMTRRPVFGGWSFSMPTPDVPARPEPRAVHPGPADGAGRAPLPPGPRPPAPPRTPSPAPFPAAAAPAPAPAPAPVPALSRPGVRRSDLSGPHDGDRRSAPAAGVPAPPVAAPPAGVRSVTAPLAAPLTAAPAPVPHLRSVRPEPPAGRDPDGTPPPGTRRTAAAAPPRPPSPPAALPAPAPPRPRQG